MLSRMQSVDKLYCPDCSQLTSCIVQTAVSWQVALSRLQSVVLSRLQSVDKLYCPDCSQLTSCIVQTAVSWQIVLSRRQSMTAVRVVLCCDCSQGGAVLHCELTACVRWSRTLVTSARWWMTGKKSGETKTSIDRHWCRELQTCRHCTDSFVCPQQQSYRFENRFGVLTPAAGIELRSLDPQCRACFASSHRPQHASRSSEIGGWSSCCLLSWSPCCLLSWSSCCLLSWSSCCLLSWSPCCLLSWSSCCLLSWSSLLSAVLIIMLSIVFFVSAIIMTSPSICVHDWSYKKNEETLEIISCRILDTQTVTNFTLFLYFKQILSVNSLAGWLTASHINTSLVSWLTS